MIKFLIILLLFVSNALSQDSFSKESDEEIESFEKRSFGNTGPKYPSCVSYLDCRPDEFCVSYRRMIAGRCATRLPEGAACSSGIHCLSGYCTWFKCKRKPTY